VLTVGLTTVFVDSVAIVTGFEVCITGLEVDPTNPVAAGGCVTVRATGILVDGISVVAVLALLDDAITAAG
tara:strand:- start:11 stop:223 length:213 start_codon:yes stop_codon:yes gene_type:complete